MKLLLVGINAKYIHSNPALYSIKACAGTCADCMEIAEYTINHRPETILADIYYRKPDVIAISCYIWNRQQVIWLTGALEKILPDVPVWAGGPEASHDAQAILAQAHHMTGVMVGEGEATCADLAAHYLTGVPALKEIKGLACRDFVSGSRELTDINAIPFLYETLAPFENRILYYESSRGCPFSCSYCLSSIDRQVRLRDMDLVKEELTFFLRHRVPQVKFVDRTFNCNQAHAMEIWRYLYEHDNGFTNFHFEIAADLLDEESFSLLGAMRPGLIQLEIGVQSTNTETLKAINRRTDLEKLKAACIRIGAGNNIHQHLDLIAGLPYENLESFRRSFNEVYALAPQQLQLGFLKVLKGSPMAEQAEAWGIRHYDTPPYEVLSTAWLTYEELLKLKNIEEMVELYYNSGQFVHTLLHLEQAFPTAYDMYERMAEYMKEQLTDGMSPSRVRRYELLLSFICAHDRDREELYRELLLLDLYAREPLKARPAFAPLPEGHKEHVKRFYRQEETERRYLKGYEGYQSKQLSKMTHLELFSYDVLHTGRRWADGRSHAILFDYRQRSPLNREAGMTELIIES